MQYFSYIPASIPVPIVRRESPAHITLLVVDGMKQREVARALEKHDSAISRKMKRLRESLKKVLPERLKILRGI